MDGLEIQDTESSFICNRSCMVDFEKRIVCDGRDRGIRFGMRYRKIRHTMSCKTYREICSVGIGSQNMIYELMFKKRLAFLLTIYYSFCVRR